MSDEPIPSSKGVVATAGKQPLPIFIDINKDGINDLEQLRETAGKHQPVAELILRTLMMFLPKHTLVYGWLAAYFAQFKPKVDAVVWGKP